MSIKIEDISLVEKLKLLSELAIAVSNKFKTEEFSVQMAQNEANYAMVQKERLLQELDTIKNSIKENKEAAASIISNAEKKASKILEEATHTRELAIINNEEAKKALLQAKEDAKTVVAEVKSQLKGK